MTRGELLLDWLSALPVPLLTQRAAAVGGLDAYLYQVCHHSNDDVEFHRTHMSIREGDAVVFVPLPPEVIERLEQVEDILSDSVYAKRPR